MLSAFYKKAFSDKRVRDFAPLLFFVAAAFVLYYPAARAGMVHDFTSWLLTYSNIGAKGLLTQFDDKGLHPLYHVAFFGLYKLFGLNPVGWFIVFTGLHALNTYLCFIFFRRLFVFFHTRNGYAIAFTGALFFLVSPYHSEPVIWKATVHYLLALFLILSTLIFSLRYLRSGAIKYVVLAQVCYIISLLLLEITFSVPLLLIALIIPGRMLFDKVSLKQFVLYLVLPQLVMLPVYFLGTKLAHGVWIGHYGAGTHLDFSVSLVVSIFHEYLFNFLAFIDYTPYNFHVRLHALLERNDISITMAGFYLLTITLFFVFYKKLPAAVKIAAMLFVMFAVSLGTIVNIRYNYYNLTENDRFNYLAAIFILMLFSYLFFRLPGLIRCAAIAIFIFFSIKFLHYNIKSWKYNGQVTERLEKSFKWQDAQQIYILNMPDDFRGTFMYRAWQFNSTFAEAVQLRASKDIDPKIHEVLYYNMNSLSDSVTVEKLSDTDLKVVFAQWGNWWWMNGYGAWNYETDEYSVTIDEWAHSYILHFKKKTPGTVYLYQAGTEWRTVENF